MSDTCYSIDCCDKDPLDTDSRNATDADDSTVGEPNPNCPEGYVWGGLGCVPEDSPQPCSTGYAWDGTECIEDDADFECANGYHLVGDDCVECDALDAPVVTFPNTDTALLECEIPATGTVVTAYVVENEQGPIGSTSEAATPPAQFVSIAAIKEFTEGAELCFWYIVVTSDCGTLTSPRTCVIFTSGLVPK